MRQAAVFIDSSYFWAQLFTYFSSKKEEKQYIDMNVEAIRAYMVDECKRQFPESTFLRIYWYDAANASGRAHSHSQLEMTSHITLRLGAFNSLGDQKIVDGLIISDMILLSQNKAVNDIILVSGDADLIPGVNVAKTFGARVHLLGVGSPAAISSMLKAECDTRAIIHESHYASFVNITDEKPEHITVADATPDGVLEDAAAKTYDKLSPDQRRQLQSTGVIPRDVDAILIREAYVLLSRALTEVEKRTLRSELKKLSV